MVGMGPCGELRYPSYRLSHWNYCGHGEFQCYDQHALQLLSTIATAVGRPDWGLPPNKTNVGGYSSYPHDNEFFTTGFKEDYGKFFLDWYSSALKDHGRRVLGKAQEVFQNKLAISGKVAGIHWWYGHDSHAAEATAGYYNTNSRNGYAEIARVFKEHGASLDFTCLEMVTEIDEKSQECHSNPEGLIAQVVEATAALGLPFSGENALQRYDEAAYTQMASHREHLHGLTYLRLNWELTRDDNLKRFKDFTTTMHGGPSEDDTKKVALRGATRL